MKWSELKPKQKRIVALTYGGIIAIYMTLTGLWDGFYGGLPKSPLPIMNPWVLTLGMVLVFMLAHGLFFGFPKRERNDSASVAPVSILLIAVSVIGFQSLMFGTSLVESSVIASIEYTECTADDDVNRIGDAFKNIACYIGNFFKFLGNVSLVIASVVRFFFNALTFNIPGAPIVVRIIVGTAFIGSIGWAIAGLSRGTSTA